MGMLGLMPHLALPKSWQAQETWSQIVLAPWNVGKTFYQNCKVWNWQQTNLYCQNLEIFGIAEMLAFIKPSRPYPAFILYLYYLYPFPWPSTWHKNHIKLFWLFKISSFKQSCSCQCSEVTMTVNFSYQRIIYKK